MLTVLDIKTNYNKVFIRQSEENKNANMTTLNYIETLAKTAGFNIAAWDIATIFKDPSNKKQSLELIKDRAIINKIFFEKMNEIKANPNQVGESISLLLKTNLEKIAKQRREVSAKRIEQDIKNEQNYIDDYCRGLSDRIARVVKYRKEMAELNGTNADDKVISDLKDVLTGNFFEFLEAKDNTLTFITKNDIYNTYVKPSANLNLNVNLGKFKVVLNMNNMELAVLPHQNNTMINGFYHPHVSERGRICWGNVSSRAASLLTKMDIKNTLLLLATLLTTYNEEAPYIALGTIKVEQDRLALQNNQTQELPF